MAAPKIRDAFCSYCGTKFAEPLAYPRTCASCGVTIWANPIPVAVVLVPVRDVDRVGLLVVRRAIPPGVGLLALVGGFVEEKESWQQGGAREVLEETGVIVPAAGLEPLWYASTEPKPNRVLLFSVAPVIERAALPPFAADGEASERGLIFGPGGLEEVFAFSLHTAAAKRYFEGHHVTGAHDFVAR
jgi:ADP-ribose pyrophosphatase YjhB (NUDIX family)